MRPKNKVWIFICEETSKAVVVPRTFFRKPSGSESDCLLWLLERILRISDSEAEVKEEKSPARGADGHHRQHEQLLATCNHNHNFRKFRSPWPWPSIGSRSYHHAQYLYQHAQPSDCRLTHCRNIAIWISWNIDIPQSLNSRDSFPRRKFNNWALTSCRPGPILSLPSVLSSTRKWQRR